MKIDPFIKRAHENARKNPQMIVFPEAELDERVIEAAVKIAKQKLAYPILMGNEEKVTAALKKHVRKIPDFIDLHDYSEKNPQRKWLPGL